MGKYCIECGNENSDTGYLICSDCYRRIFPELPERMPSVEWDAKYGRRRYIPITAIGVEPVPDSEADFFSGEGNRRCGYKYTGEVKTFKTQKECILFFGMHRKYISKGTPFNFYLNTDKVWKKQWVFITKAGEDEN